MQKKPNSMKRFWKDNGYYILLGLCLAAVGVSGYFLVSGALGETEQTQQVLSIPVTVEKEPGEQSRTESMVVEEPETTAPVQGETAQEAVLAQEPEVILPVSGAVLQDYAMDRLVYHDTTRDWRVHGGVDLAAEPGQNVRAARAGTVEAVYDDEYYGTTVVLRHENGYTSRYCNLAEATLVSAGDSVTAGQVIGTIGATALIESAAESHLHFEVLQNGEPVDPAGFLY